MAINTPLSGKEDDIDEVLEITTHEVTYSKLKVQGSRFFILSYEHSYSVVMPMKFLGHRLLQQSNTITQINRKI